MFQGFEYHFSDNALIALNIVLENMYGLNKFSCIPLSKYFHSCFHNNYSSWVIIIFTLDNNFMISGCKQQNIQFDYKSCSLVAYLNKDFIVVT